MEFWTCRLGAEKNSPPLFFVLESLDFSSDVSSFSSRNNFMYITYTNKQEAREFGMVRRLSSEKVGIITTPMVQLRSSKLFITLLYLL